MAYATPTSDGKEVTTDAQTTTPRTRLVDETCYVLLSGDDDLPDFDVFRCIEKSARDALQAAAPDEVFEQ